MGLLEFILIVVFLSAVIGPLAKGVGNRLGRGGPSPAELARLRGELERMEQRLGDTERRLYDAEERLDFQEKLIGSRPALPEPKPGDASEPR